jgi:hypothetical protein
MCKTPWSVSTRRAFFDANTMPDVRLVGNGGEIFMSYGAR